jgi:hypothetical protein
VRATDCAPISDAAMGGVSSSEIAFIKSDGEMERLERHRHFKIATFEATTIVMDEKLFMR